MDKEQALHSFWSQFGVPAYDLNTVPDSAPLPRITYQSAVDNIDHPTMVSASVWDRGTSWKVVSDILRLIESAVGRGGQTIRTDSGLLWVKRATPFAQRIPDTDDSIRRIAINIEIEYLTEV